MGYRLLQIVLTNQREKLIHRPSVFGVRPVLACDNLPVGRDQEIRGKAEHAPEPRARWRQTNAHRKQTARQIKQRHQCCAWIQYSA